ncbi:MULTISPECIES: hypothetical protein [Bradyrhizobium]|uniref:hypothetical protein n=1 Tax=Bradyrhizobium TaxID=374 RepID=UPI000FE1476D|nr:MULTISPECIES: hypothetical protein [Bradyrhizobium]
MQAALRVDPAQLALRAILLGEVPRNLQAAIGAQQGLLEVAVSLRQNLRPIEENDLTARGICFDALKGDPMTTVDAMLVGAILAWMPSLIVFLYIVRDLRNMPREDLD